MPSDTPASGRLLRLLRDPRRWPSALRARLAPREAEERLVRLETTVRDLRRRLEEIEARPAGGADPRVHLLRVAGFGAAPAARPLSVLIDARITQMRHNERGISRYTTGFAIALGARLPGRVSVLLDPELPDPAHLAEIARHCGVVRGTAAIPALEGLSHYIQACLFALSRTVEELVPAELARFRPRLWTIAYDLIPRLFPEHYLAAPSARRRYDELFDALPLFHHHLAISRSTAEDLTRLAHIPPDAITVVHGGLDAHRWPETPEPPPGELVIDRAEGGRLAIPRPFWLYVGGADHRKNVEGLLKGFGEIRRLSGEPPPTLVIACDIPPWRRDELLELAAERGLAEGRDLILTGLVDDRALAFCYRAAFATIFPSLYEGLGLPLIESYHFGTPALAADTSALRELAPPECRFDPEDPSDIARAVLAFQAGPELRDLSLAFGREVLGVCNWPTVADKAAARLLEDTLPSARTTPD